MKTKHNYLKWGCRVSLGWIALSSVVSAANLFYNIHPWTKALEYWYVVPWTGFLAYWFGRSDGRRLEAERQLKELGKLDERIKEYSMLMKMRTTFNFKNDQPN